MWFSRFLVWALVNGKSWHDGKSPETAEIFALRQELAHLKDQLAQCAEGLKACQGSIAEASRRSEESGDIMWKVTSGDCMLHDGCLFSPNYPQDYPAFSRCEVAVTPQWSGFLHTDGYLDSDAYFDVDSARYGAAQFSDLFGVVVPKEAISWSTTYGGTEWSYYSDYFWKVCRAETLPVWSLTFGNCFVDHLGCLAPDPIVWVGGSCKMSIDEDWEGTIDIGTLDDGEYIFRANGLTYTQDNIDQLQGLVVHGEFEVRHNPFTQFSICPGEPPNMSGPWGTEPWTWSATGDPCGRLYEFRGVAFGACTQQFSDTGDADGDGSAHNGHPHCVTSVGDSLCGPCSCGPGEEQTYMLSRLYGHTPQVPLVFCSLCTLGKFRSVGNNSGPDECQECPRGFSSLDGATACVACSPGWIDADVGCVQCAAGTFATSTSMTACVPCDTGRFQEASGQSACTSCSEVQNPSGRNAHLWTTFSRVSLPALSVAISSGNATERTGSVVQVATLVPAQSTGSTRALRVTSANPSLA